ncbi:MAG: hypothetical protein QOI95_3279 [Acidimicrobiaceae bacterium]
MTVTFRRTDLLRAAIASVLGQTRRPDAIVVVDNGDVATSVLARVSGVEVVKADSNLGPAGGYALGFGLALERGADKIWVVDDDDEAEPECLERLLSASSGNDVVIPFQRKPDRDQGFPPSWNGPLFDAAAVRAAGLPRADLFFWAEDTEYFLRIARAGIPVRHAPDAMMLHQNPLARVKGAQRDWRLYYEIRNGLWLRLKVRDRTFKQYLRSFLLVTRTLLSIVLLERGKRASLRLWWMGVSDFARGHLGKRVDPATWTAARGSR